MQYSFTIDPKIFDQFPELRVGVVVVENVNNAVAQTEIIKLLRASEAEAGKKYAGAHLGEMQEIACWRRAYKSFGANDYRSSIEALLRRAVKGDSIPDINPLVNLYNALSLKYLIPFGGEDLSRVEGDIVLGYAHGDEPCALIGETENRPPKQGEIVYKDDAGVLCRRWNWRESDRMKLEKSTTRAILVCEDLWSGADEVCFSAVSEYLELCKEFLHAQGRVEVLQKGNQSTKIC